MNANRFVRVGRCRVVVDEIEAVSTGPVRMVEVSENTLAPHANVVVYTLHGNAYATDGLMLLSDAEVEVERIIKEWTALK